MSRPNSNLQGYVGVANSQVEVERIVFAAMHCPAIVFVLVSVFYLTNRPQFSMVYILIDHRNAIIEMFKTQVEPREAGDCSIYYFSIHRNSNVSSTDQ